MLALPARAGAGDAQCESARTEDIMTRKRLSTIRALLRQCVAFMLGNGTPVGLTLRPA